MIVQCPKCSHITDHKYIVDNGCIFYFLEDGIVKRGCNYILATALQKRIVFQLMKNNKERKNRYV